MNRAQQVIAMCENATTLPSFNKELQKEYPGLVLVKGKGYFYFTTDEKASAELAKYISRKNSTSVMANSFNQMPYSIWREELVELMKDFNQQEK